MKLRSLLLTVIVLAALSAVVYFVRRPAPARAADPRLGQPLVAPAVVEKAAKLQLGDQGKSVTLERAADGVWHVTNYYDFPADFSKLTRLTNDLAEAKLERLVTTNPERIARLEFKDTKIELFDSAKKELWSATFGKTAETGGRFVRFGTEQKAFLASLSAWLDAEPKNWADTTLLSLKPEDVSRIELSFPDGSIVAVSRPKKEDPWTATPTPANQVVNPDKISSLLTTVGTLRFSDTTEPTDANAVAAKAHQRMVKLTTFDGKTIEVALGRKPEEKKLKAPVANADGKTGPGTLGSVSDLAAKEAAPKTAEGSPAAAEPAKPITPEYDTIPAGPVFVTVTSSDANAPVNALMHKRAFQISDYIFTGLPQNSAELFHAAPPPPAPAPKPAPATSAGPATAPAPKS